MQSCKPIHKVLVAAMSLFLACGLAACGDTSSSDAPDFIDDRAMSIIAEGFETRSDTLDRTDPGTTDEEYAEYLKTAVQAEIDNGAELKSAQYEDSKLQEAVISYLNLLDDSIEVIDTYPASSIEFSENWQEIYDERSLLLATFVDEYGLTVGNDYQGALDEIIKNSNAVEESAAVEGAIESLVSSLKFEKSDEQYGWYTYTAIGENTSEYNFGNVSLNLALYDADGVKAEDAYASTNSWASGEKVKFEVMSDVDAKDIKVSISYYDLEE